MPSIGPDHADRCSHQAVKTSFSMIWNVSPKATSQNLELKEPCMIVKVHKMKCCEHTTITLVLVQKIKLKALDHELGKTADEGGDTN